MKYIYKNINKIRNSTLKKFYEKLSKNDKKRIDKILNEKRKKQFIVGRLLLNELLVKHYNTNYFENELVYNKNGKPYFKRKDINFNISHSNDYVICCVSNKKIGIDIEKIKKINKIQMKQYTTEKEFENIKNDTEAFQIYSLKEAYFKMKGSNLNKIKTIEFKLEKNILCNKKNITIQTIKNIKGYTIAICEKKENFSNIK